jgi:peptide/nickel transport system permease protein
MIRLAFRRLLMTPPVIFSIVTLVFFMTQLIPGDQARIAAGRDATVEQVEAMRIKLGLDSPLYVQFGQYLDRLLHGDLGTSVFTYRPVCMSCYGFKLSYFLASCNAYSRLPW